MPANAVPDSTVVTFVYKKEGKEVEFTADKFPADFSKDKYEFVKRYDKVVKRQNNEPPIKGFALSGDSNVDSAQYVLDQPYAVLLFIEKVEEAGSGWKKEFEKFILQQRIKISLLILLLRLQAIRKIDRGHIFPGYYSL